MAETTALVKAALANGSCLYIETVILNGEEEVAFTMPSFKEITDVLEGIADSMVTTLKKIKPRKASVEFGLEVALESGQLTALLVKGSGTANLKVTLEWGELSSEG